jgi:hypothetical protein
MWNALSYNIAERGLITVEKVMTILYHYSDVDGFFNIIKSKKLWLSGPHNLNDHQEMHWALRKIRTSLEKMTQEYPIDQINILWEIISSNQVTPFVCSLSSEGDLLSQWRAYARNGTGLAIGFSKELCPNSGTLPHHTILAKNSITTMRLTYDDDEQDRTIDKILRSAFLSIASDENWTKSHALIDAAFRLNGLAPSYKNKAFSEEAEWRIIYTPMIMGNINTNTITTQAGISEIKHRTSSGKLITYFEYDFSHLVENDFVVDLVLGPKCEIQNYDLELFLSMYGFEKLRFRRSTASYR